MVSFFKGFVTGASKQFVEDENKKEEFQRQADQKALDRINGLEDAFTLTKYKHDLKKEEGRLDKERFISSLAELTGGKVTSEGQLESVSSADMKTIEAFYDAGNPSEAIKVALNSTKYKADEVKDIETLGQAKVKEKTITYEGSNQPIDFVKEAMSKPSNLNNPLGVYGMAYKAETTSLATDILNYIGEFGRVEGTGKTTVSPDAAGEIANQLLRARSDLVYNPLKDDGDKSRFIAALKELEVADQLMEQITGAPYNPFSNQKLFPKSFIKKLSSDEKTKSILESIGGISTNTEKPKTDFAIGSIVYKGNKPYRVKEVKADGQVVVEEVQTERKSRR